MKGNYPDLRGLSSTFGESRYDHFHNGLDISSSEDPVYAMAAGTVLFSRESSDDPFAPTQGPGNYLILDHGEGMWSGYYHLHSLGSVRQGAVDTQTPLGLSGNTGHSAGSHLHFFLISDYGRVYHNPLEYLPPVTDPEPPVMGSLVIVTPQGITNIGHSREEKIRLTRSYPVYVSIIDPALEKRMRRGVYSLEWSLNGNPAESRTFSRILNTGKGWLLEDKYEFPLVFQDQYYNLGELAFTDGENVLTMKATDYNGNVSEAVYKIKVQREY